MSFRILVTGASGFVGCHLLKAVKALPADTEVLATSRFASHHPEFGVIEQLNVTNEIAVEDAIRRFTPTHVVHLAGMTAIPVAMANPDAAWHLHLFGTLNIAQAILKYAPECFLIYAGTGQVYGASAEQGEALDEMKLLAPLDTYTSSKAAADLALGAMARHGLRCVRFRPFNHIGPGQSEDFVISSFAMQLARIKQRHQAPLLRVGNLSVHRDFVDVRDIASAYRMAITKSDGIASGTIFNLASGVPRSIQDVLKMLICLAEVSVEIETDASRLRAVDVPVFVGDATKAKAMLGWHPAYRFEDTLREIVESSARLVTSQYSELPGGRD